ncbi:MAG: peptidoglycan D,D-transpeptidase FtsI family protein [Weeksellaceae bacterium]
MNRLRIIFFLFLVGFLIIIIRLFSIQLLKAGAYATDYLSTQKLTADRGKILDRNMEPLAVNQTKYLLYIEPQKMKDKNELIDELDEILEIGEATLEARIDPEKQWISIKGNLTKETKTKLEALKLPEIGFQEEYDRYYPESSLAAHLLGFVGKDDKGENTGYFGVEGYYDRDLTGLPGVLKSERDLFNKPIFFGTQEKVNAEHGRTMVLTIDKTVQHIIKSKLAAAVEQYKAKAGCVLAVDPYTMEVLGSACVPDFDPDEYYDFATDDYKNWMISSVYEPGSTFKPLVMSAAIEEGKLKANGNFNEKGPVELGGYTIRNWNDKYEGKISITRILEKSSNIGMVHTGDVLGNEKLYEYIDKYGFNEATGIDLQGEISGQVKPLESWYPIDAATMTFGQGISVTAMQLVRAFGALVNGGYLMQPYIVKEMVSDGEKRVREPVTVRRVISERTSETMKKMLVSTVGNAEAKWDIPEGFTFGGKTGTAQIAFEGNYDATKTVASFIGFAPADKPKFLMMVVIREPSVSSWGSETAAPLFFDIAQDMLIYYNVSPS